MKKINVPVKSERVKEFMRLMAKGQWVRRITAQEFADKWEMRIETVERDAAEASRRLTGEVEGNEELRELIGITLQTAISDLQKLATVHSVRNPRVAVQAIAEKIRAAQVMIGLRGIQSPTKIEVSNNLGELLAAAATQEAREKLE
jgi:hypothetical protein